MILQITITYKQLSFHCYVVYVYSQQLQTILHETNLKLFCEDDTQ